MRQTYDSIHEGESFALDGVIWKVRVGEHGRMHDPPGLIFEWIVNHNS